MMNGDISNETSPRIIVSIDVVAESEIVENKRFARSAQVERKVKGINNLALSHLWNMANKYGLSVELLAYEDDLWTQEMLDKFMARLDNRGANPFNYAQVYEDVASFVGDMPYRPNLQGVIDTRERVARYGSKGIELENF